MSLYRSPDFGTATGEKCCLFTSAGRHFETCSDTLFWTFATTAANELFSSHDVPSFSGMAIAGFLSLHFMIFLLLFGKYKHTVRLRLFPSLSVSYSGPGGGFVCQVWALWWCLDVDSEWVTVSKALSWKCLLLGHYYSLYALLREEMRGKP